jgi:hypothetical protein
MMILAHRNTSFDFGGTGFSLFSFDFRQIGENQSQTG